MEAALGGIGAFMVWLGNHQREAYFVLFLGSYFETLVGPSFFIPGELFLLSGAILGGTQVLNIWYVIVALYTGAVLGDNSSYVIGRYTSKSIFKEGRRIFNIKNYNKGAAFFDKYGSRAIFFARIMGPLSWVTPFLAGIYKVPYKTFFSYNTPGIIVGVGEFIIIGYFFGDQYQRMFDVVNKYFTVSIIAIVILFVVYWIWKRNNTFS